jgi:hypothetical protein
MFKTAGVVTWRRHQLTRGSKVPTFNQTITAIQVGSISQTQLPWSGIGKMSGILRRTSGARAGLLDKRATCARQSCLAYVVPAVLR